MKRMRKVPKGIIAWLLTVFMFFNSMFLVLFSNEVVAKAEVDEDISATYVDDIVEGKCLLVEQDGVYILDQTDAFYGIRDNMTPYTGQSGKWEYSDGVLTLKEGFDFKTTAGIALLVNDTDNFVINVEGNVSVGYGIWDTGDGCVSNAVLCSSTSLEISGTGTLNIKPITGGTQNSDMGIAIQSKELIIDIDGTVNAVGRAVSGDNTFSIGVSTINLTVKKGELNAVGGDVAEGQNVSSAGALITSSLTVTGGTFNAYSEYVRGFGVCVNSNITMPDTTVIEGATDKTGALSQTSLIEVTDGIMDGRCTFASLDKTQIYRYVRCSFCKNDKILVFFGGKLYLADYENNNLNLVREYTGQKNLWSVDSEGALVLEDGFCYETTASYGLIICAREDGQANKIKLNKRAGDMKIACGIPGDDGSVNSTGHIALMCDGELYIGGMGSLYLEGPEKVGTIGGVEQSVCGLACDKLTVDIFLGDLIVNGGNMGDAATGNSVGIYVGNKFTLKQGYVYAKGRNFGLITSDFEYKYGEYSDGALDAAGKTEALCLLQQTAVTGDNHLIYGTTAFDSFDEITPVTILQDGRATVEGGEVAHAVRILPSADILSLFYGTGEGLRIGCTPSDRSISTVPYEMQTDKWRIRGNELQLDAGFSFSTAANVVMCLTNEAVIRINGSDEDVPVKLTYSGNKNNAYGLYCYRSVTFTGNGHLIISGTDENSTLAGAISTTGDMTVDLNENGRIDCIADTGYGTAVDNYEGKLNMLFGTLYAKGNSCGIYTDAINYTDGYIYATGSESGVTSRTQLPDFCIVKGSTVTDSFTDMSETNVVVRESWGRIYYDLYVGEEPAKSVYVANGTTHDKEYRSLYFDAKTGRLYTIDSNFKKLPYTEQTDKWTVDESGALVLKDGFSFSTTADSAFIIDKEDAVLRVEGNVTIEQCSEALGNDYIQSVINAYRSLTIEGNGTLNLIKKEIADTYSSYAIHCEDALVIDMGDEGIINATVEDKRENSGNSVAVLSGQLILENGTLNARAGASGSYESLVSIGVLVLYVEDGLNISGGKLNATGRDYAVGVRDTYQIADNMISGGNAQYNAADRKDEIRLNSQKKTCSLISYFYTFETAEGNNILSLSISEKSGETDAPVTGDNSGILWIILLMLASLSAACVCVTCAEK